MFHFDWVSIGQENQIQNFFIFFYAASVESGTKFWVPQLKK